MRAVALLAVAALAAAGCGRWRHRRHRARREVDPRAANATACLDPRYLALSRVPLRVVGRATDVRVAGGGGARYVVWSDDAGTHAWDLSRRRADVPPGQADGCRAAWDRLGASVPSPCGAVASTARGGGRVARLAVEDRGGPALTVTTGGEAQQLSGRYDPAEPASLAWDGGAFAVAWTEPVRGAPSRAYLALVDRDGRRMGSAMRLRVEDPVGLRGARVAFAGPDYLVAALRDDGGIELRETGPRGCDEPLLPPPVADGL